MSCPKCNYGYITSEDVEDKSQRELLMYQCDYCGWIWIVRQYGEDLPKSETPMDEERITSVPRGG